MELAKGHIISKISPQSIAADLGLQPGDRVLSLDERPVQDIFDFYLRQLPARLSLGVEKADGETIIFDIEKDEDEQLGIDFAQPLLDNCTTCHNRCLFCFIDQLPPGMRSSLYLKDDDLRLSFLSGTYVTLTNISDEELDRLISYRFSPMNISVHTTDDKLRRRMMGNKQASGIMEKLHRIAAGRIAINAQIVLCPDLNDKDALEKTIGDLVSLGPALQSLAIVPVGLTRYRQQNKLYPLRPLGREDADQIVHTVEKWQGQLLTQRNRRIVFASDEIYIKAGRPFPSYDEYEDFPQLENGVGMMAQTLQEIEQGLADGNIDPRQPLYAAWPETLAEKLYDRNAGAKSYLLATGMSAASWLSRKQDALQEYFHADIEFMPVENIFFGKSVTVTGLITGQDLSREFCRRFGSRKKAQDDDVNNVALVLPACMFKADSPVMLDDISVQDLADCLGVPVFVCPATGQGLLSCLAWLADYAKENSNE